MTTQTARAYLNRSTPPHISTLIIITGIATLSMNLFLPSLPNMADSFGVDYTTMQLSVTVFLASTGALQLLIGPISDRFGRRPVLLISISLFILMTLGCMLATDFWVFLAFRIAQTVIVAGLVLGRAIVRDVVPTERAASAIAYVTMGMALIQMTGPTIGGVLDEAFGWRANFAFLTVLGLMVLMLAWSDLGETANNRPTSLIAQFREYPELLTSPRFWGYCLAAATASGAFFAYLGGAPFVASELFGLSTVQVGYYFGAPALGYFTGNFISGRMSQRIGINRMILTGAIISTLGLCIPLALSAAGTETAAIFFGSVTIVGIGNGMLLPNANAGMLSVRPHLAGTASGLGGAIMIMGGAGLAQLAGAQLNQDSGAFPLILIMTLSSSLSVLSILLVIRRERRLHI